MVFPSDRNLRAMGMLQANDATAKLTSAQRRELIRVHKTGHSKTRAGYSLRKKGLTEFAWKLSNGKEIVDSNVDQQGWYDQMQGAVCQGERLTPAGIAALGRS